MTSFLDYQAIPTGEVSKIDRAIDEFRHTKRISCPTSRLYFKMMAVLRERRRLAIVDGDLKLGGEMDTLIREISDFFLENKLFVSKAEKVAIVQNEYETERARLDELEAKWASELNGMIQQRDREEGRVEELARTNLQTFDASMPGELPPEFTRLSADLLDLREKEKHLVGSRRFPEAARLHAEFLKRQNDELVRRREEFAEHFEHDRNEVERRNYRRTSTVQSDWNRKINHFRHMMNSELAPLRQGVANLLEKLMTAKSEYIGEDDPILRNEPQLMSARDSGNLMRVSAPVFTRGLLPRTMVATTRAIEREKALMSTRRMAEAMKRQSQKFDSRRQSH
jgi:hypothetical protein